MLLLLQRRSYGMMTTALHTSIRVHRWMHVDGKVITVWKCFLMLPIRQSLPSLWITLLHQLQRRRRYSSLSFENINECLRSTARKVRLSNKVTVFTRLEAEFGRKQLFLSKLSKDAVSICKDYTDVKNGLQF
jgi:hypothetical protein